VSAEDHLSRIEAALAEIERLDIASGAKLRQAHDRECFDVVCRIERQMQQGEGNDRRSDAETSG
jgi:hypothetical protein